MIAASMFAAIAVLATSTEADARPVTAVWDPNTDPYTVGYRLYYGPASGSYGMEINVGNVTSYPLNLIPGIPHYFVVRAYNASGQLGPASNEFPVMLANNAPTLFNPGAVISVPAGPIDINLPAVDPDGDPLTFTMTGLPASISVDTGSGRVFGMLVPGTYSVTATTSDGHLQASTTFTLIVSGAGCATPGPPAFAAPAVSGSTVSLSWTPGGGGPPSSYVLSVGTAFGLSNLVTLDTALATSVSGPLADGVYFARVVGRGACGDSPTSNEVSFRIGAPPGPVPGPTGGLTFQRSGRTVTLAWNAASEAGAYVIEVGSASGLSNLLVYNTGSLARSITTVAPSGHYFVRIRAFNANGIGSASNEIVINVP